MIEVAERVLIILVLIVFCSCGENKTIVDDDFNDSDTDQPAIEESCEDKKYDKWDLTYKEDIYVEKIKALKNGELIFTGAWNEFQDPWHINFSMVGCLNPDFTTKWGVIFEEVGRGRDVNDLTVADNGEVYVCGTKNDNTFWMAAFSQSGEVIWEKDWKYNGFYKLGSAILYSIKINNQSLFVAGFIAGWNEEGKATFPLLYLAETDFEGNLLWEKIWGPGGSLINDMEIDDAGNIYLAGYTTGDVGEKGNAGNIGDCDGFFQFGPIGESSCPDPFLIKTDKNGNVVWRKQWGTGSFTVESANKIIIKDNFVFVLSDVSGKESFGFINITKFNKDGKIIFNNDYTENGRDFIESAYDFYIDKNGVLIVGGVSREEDAPKEGYLIAIDPNTGQEIGSKKFIGAKSGLVVTSIYEDAKGLKFAGLEESGAYEPIPGETYYLYNYGINDVGYFYNEENNKVATSGNDFERQTLLAGSEKDDEVVFSFTDSEKNIFVVGNTWGKLNGVEKIGEKDVYVSKYNSEKTLEWTKLFGTKDWDCVSAGAVDSEGNIIVTGSTWGSFSDYDVFLGISDVFVMKIDNEGNLIWRSVAGSRQNDWANNIHVSKNDEIYVVGGSYGSIEGAEYTSGFGCNAFIGKWSSSGDKGLFKMFGERIEGMSVASDSENIYMVGRTDVRRGDQYVYETGISDSIIFKLDENLEEQWARIWGSVEVDSATDIAVDSVGDIYVTGYTFGAIDGNIHLGADCPGGYCPDAYLTKWDSTGKKKWTRQFGTEFGDRATSIAIDENDGIYVSGTAGKNRLCEIESDIFLIKSDTSGNLEEIKAWGTAGEEKVNDINISNGKIIISGFTTGGLDDNDNLGGKDGFVTVTEIESKE